jgi:hypothetical protein
MLHFKVPGVGIEPTASWFRARRHYQQQLPRSKSAKSRQRRRHQVRGEGVEPSSPGSKPGSLPLADPRSHSPRVPCGNRTRLISLEGWCLCRSAKGAFIQGGRRGSRTLKAFLVLDGFRDGCHRQLACPSVGLTIQSCGGWSRTSNRLLNRELPYRWATPQSISQDGGI